MPTKTKRTTPPPTSLLRSAANTRPSTTKVGGSASSAPRSEWSRKEKSSTDLELVARYQRTDPHLIVTCELFQDKAGALFVRVSHDTGFSMCERLLPEHIDWWMEHYFTERTFL